MNKTVRIIPLEKEGFLSSIVMEFGNGLIIRSYDDLAWAGVLKKKEVLAQVEELLDQLEKDGWEVTNKESLDEFK